MLKKRIIPVQLLMNGRLVKTKSFDSFRDVGDPVASSRVYNSQLSDELVFLNIERDPSRRNIQDLARLIDKVSEVCFMPLAMGGGITKVADASLLISSGADKVILNSAAYENTRLLHEISDRFGAQALVVSIDAKRRGDDFVLVSDCGRREEKIGLEEHIRNVIAAGAGEIFINSIDNDGQMQGYDLELLKRAASAASVPVIGCGGAGTFYHLLEAFRTANLSALACGSLFNFGDNNPIRAKAFLSNYGLPFKSA